MRYLLIILTLYCSSVWAGDYNDVVNLARKNGFDPPSRVVRSIVRASTKYNINPLELTAIGIAESGLGKYSSSHLNKNGTVDTGVFQINSVNRHYCLEYNLANVEGSTFCAAKLVAMIRLERSGVDSEWLGVYHSKSKKRKRVYFEKIVTILALGDQ